ncbi:MAG TPA: hypothetical protein VE621_08800 [Bryobacteraceae bacterium]|jgi:hypothetical protein|nr:hypothetical protein [Bryobacteraceae bacterium]
MTGTGRVSNGERRMKMAQDQRVIFWPGEIRAVTVGGCYGAVGPGHNIFERKMRKLGSEAPIVIASNHNKLRIGCKPFENPLDPSPFWRAGTGSMNDIAQKDKTFGLELIAHSEQLLARTSISQGPEFATSPLRPAIAKMKVRNENRPRFRNAKSSGGVRIELGRDR